MDPIGRGPGVGDMLSELRSGNIQDPHERLEAASKLLEGTFYQELFKVMRETIPEDGVLEGGQGREMFEGLMDQHIADVAAMDNDRGLGSALYRYLSQALPPEGATEG